MCNAQKLINLYFFAENSQSELILGEKERCGINLCYYQKSIKSLHWWKVEVCDTIIILPPLQWFKRVWHLP